MEIRLLGQVEARQDGHVVPLGGVKPRALLAILALHANTPVSADRLIEGLWGDRPPATAHKLVQVLVSQLRKQLADAGAEIVTRGRGYELRVDPDAVDALCFERLLVSGENGSGAVEALALWRGPPLDDLADEPFAAPEIRRLEDLWLGAREAAVDAELADGRHTEALGELDALLREHPLRERMHGQRMLALYRSGRQAEALDAFRDARQVLLDEVGLEPGPELRRLNDAILRQDADLDGPPTRRLPDRVRRRPWLLLAAAAVALAGAVALGIMQLGGSDGLARVSENAIGVIDPANGHIVAQYPVGHVPDALTAGAGSVWAANSHDGTVSRIDRGRRQVTTIPVGGEPTAVAFGAGSLWLADGQSGRIAQVDSGTNRVVARLHAGNGPRGVAVAGGSVWVTSAIDGQVDRLDLAHGGRIQHIDVSGGPAAIAAGGGAVWVAGEEDGIVTKLDPRTGAALRAIRVGNGPAALAVGYGAVWVANRDDGTVTRIDTATGAVTDLVRVGGSPVAVAAGLGGVWAGDGAAGAVVRIDPRTRAVTRRVALGSAPSALALAGGSLWSAAVASRASHRGGTLRFESAPTCGCVDTASYDGTDWPVLSLAYDGLVAYRRIPGAGGSTLVANLATSLPQPADGGRTYVFQLRPGLRFSDGTPVGPQDFRASIERVVRLDGQIAPVYEGIVGADACSPTRCDLSRGIQIDAAARTITIHLRHSDNEFEHKLALPLAYVLPARAPAKLIRGRPMPGTGPYRIAAFAPGRSERLVRNPHFHSWSAEASPDGYPDAIDVSFAADPTTQLAAVQRGRADLILVAGQASGQLSLTQAQSVALGDASRVYVAPAATTNYLFLNVREPPFDDQRVREALSYAIDRRRVVQLAGGGRLAALTCQLIPPGVLGYVPACPFTRAPTQAGAWTGPDLARARRLVAASGTRGARVQVWGFAGRYMGIVRYTAKVLSRLGYRVSIGVKPDPQRYFDYVDDSRHGVQIGFAGWVADYLTPSSFFEPFTCSRLVRDSSANQNISQFCDHAVDAGYTAALAAHGTGANARWAAVERRALAAAPAIPLFNRRTLLLVSPRVGNVQVHSQLGPLLDQFWVR